MQVNFNPSVNQSRPNFKALKSIKFEGEALQNCARAQKELLTIFDHPKLKSIFEKHDGEVLFKTYQKKFYTEKKLCYEIRIFENLSEKFSKIKQEYIEKAKKENLSSDIFEGIKSDQYRPDYCFNLPDNCITLHYIYDDIIEKSKQLTKFLERDLEELDMNWCIENHKGLREKTIRSEFESVLNRELKLPKNNNIDEVNAKVDVANKLKELLGE